MSFEKVTLAEPSDFVPGLGNVANGGATLTLTLDGDWQEEKYNTMVAAGYRVIERWTVETCWCGMNYRPDKTERHFTRWGHLPEAVSA